MIAFALEFSASVAEWGRDGGLVYRFWTKQAVLAAKCRSPVVRLPMPLGLTAVPGARAGDVVLRWKSLRGAKSYCVEQRADEAAPDAWTLSTSSTKARATVKGLMSGRKYWLRVAAIGSAGQGAWSDAVGVVVG